MNRPRKDAKIKITLSPRLHDWLEETVAGRSDIGMTRDRLITEALQFYATQDEDALGPDCRRVCCGTNPAGGHRGTCRYGAMRGGPDSREYQALRRMWQSQG